MTEEFGGRQTRFEGILPTDRMAHEEAMIVGCGAIGRQVAVQLATMGIGQLKLVDFDTVAPLNLGTQGWEVFDLGKPKVEALAATIKRVNPDVSIRICERKWQSGEDRTVKTVFCCADSMAVRREVFETFMGHFFCDGRMGAEILRAFAVTRKPDNGGKGYYPNTLFSDAQAAEAPCTARSTFYCASLAASVMVSMWAKYIRGLPPEKEVFINLLAGYMEAK